MFRRFAFLVQGLFLFSIISNAQVDPDATGYYTEALKYSQTTAGGTARFQSIGGVNTALGGDLSSLAGNPAGMGFYKKSELGISMALGVASTSTNYLNTTQKDSRENIYFPNLGMVFTHKKEDTDEGIFRGGAFGIGLTRISSFSNQFGYNATNKTNSIADYFVDIANGTPSQTLYNEENDIQDLQGLAYWTYVINDDPNDGTHTKYINYAKNHSEKQSETVLSRGAINQWNFSYGGNFNDKVYIGASLGVPIIRSLTDKTYKESFSTDSIDYFKLTESTKVRGTGVNFKIGMILKPQDWIRIGLTIQTPTYYGINETYSYNLKTVYNGDLFWYSSNEKLNGSYRYNLTTPLRASAGLALFAGKSGFISADLEYVPYAQARLKEAALYVSSDNSTFEGDNRTLANIDKKSAFNIRVGGEWRRDIYRLRAGFSSLGNAYNNIDNLNRKTTSFSLGAGIRLEDYYIDMALVSSRYNSIYKPYTLNNGTEPTASTKNNYTSLIISAGLFF